MRSLSRWWPPSCRPPPSRAARPVRSLCATWGAKFVGYTTKQAEKGSVDVANPMFVQYMLPLNKKHPYPIVLIHGGGGQGSDWLQTPDGRDGWADYFVADGWDVYVVDRPGHGRSQRNPACRDGKVGVANSAIVSRLSHSSPTVWPGGEPTATNDAVIGFEAAGANPFAAGFNNGPPLAATWVAAPKLPADFKAVEKTGCAMQGEHPSTLTNYAGLPIVVVGSEMGLANEAALKCQAEVWRQAGANATYVYLPDRGLKGGGHFAMAQIDSAKYAAVFLDIAAGIETTSKK